MNKRVAPLFEVVDFHVHLPVKWPQGSGVRSGVERYLSQLSEEQLARLRAFSQAAAAKRWETWGFEPPEEEPPDAQTQVDRWASEVDKYGLRLVVCTTGGGNDQLSELVGRHPGKLVGFAHHQPVQPGAAAELDRAVTQLGLAGYKIFGTGQPIRLDDESLDPVWETAQRLSVPVLVHFGVGTQGMGLAAGPSADPLVLQDVARRFVDIPFVVPHFGAGYLRELLLLCWACPNVHVDCSGSNEWLQWVPEKLDRRDVLRRFYETIGPKRLIFGTDSSYFPRGFMKAYLDDWLEVAADIGMNEAEMALMFGGNALRLLGLK